MRQTIAISLAGLVLCSCAAQPVAPGGGPQSYNNLRPPAGQAAAVDPGCVVRSHHGSIRPGDNIPTNVAVTNTGRWCFFGTGFSGISSVGARLIDPPDHGEVRVLQLAGGGVAIGYRPVAGYVGGDSFIVSLPGGFGYESNVSTTVSVRAPSP